MTVKQSVEIKNRLGMHARPAMKLYDLVQQFQSQVILRNSNNVQAEAHSVIAMLMLDSEQGSYIEVEATGIDEQQALSAIIALFNSGFDEE
ncbi:PTS phosphocarrier protein NPr [Xenorhabdus bharatensis]|uniref:PTS phosphocarrier protein NPr n=1 Tax=Xenorhabdus bharatensis TaxID=3136256 RepID=UPI0030F42B07